MDLLALATKTASERDARAKYETARRAEVSTILDGAYLELEVFDEHDTTHPSSGKPSKFRVVRQYPGIVVKSQYNEPEYRLAVEYVPADDTIYVQAIRQTRPHSPEVKTFAGSVSEQVTLALTTLAAWIGEKLRIVA